jgi:hypothetical protein
MHASKPSAEPSERAGQPGQAHMYICIYVIAYIYISQVFTNFKYNLMKYKVQFEVVNVADLKKTQQKINTWLTTGRLKKFEMHVLDKDSVLFNMCVVKDTAE